MSTFACHCITQLVAFLVPGWLWCLVAQLQSENSLALPIFGQTAIDTSARYSFRTYEIKNHYNRIEIEYRTSNYILIRWLHTLVKCADIY